MVFGLLAPDEGEVRWKGQRVDASHWLRFGYLPEERGLYPRMRVRDQVIYFGRLRNMKKSDAGRVSE